MTPATTPAPARDSRLRVLHWITHLGLGGAETVALSLIRGLKDHCRSAVYAVEGLEKNEVGRAMRAELATALVPTHLGSPLPAKLGGMVIAGLRGARVVRDFKPDLIHLHTEIPEAGYSAMVALCPATRRVPLLRTIHNSRYWHHWPRLGRWCENRMRRSVVACVSEDARAAFEATRARSGAGDLPSRASVIYNGSESTASASSFASTRRELRSPNQPVRILFAGRFEDQKGADLLPAIVARVRPRQSTSCELVLHGSGTHERRLLNFAAQPPAGWTIRVLPPVANLIAHFASFDLVILPSRFEGLSLVTIESSLAGLPVVATDAEGLREALPSDHPWRARAGDAASFAAVLQRALDEPQRWAAGAAAARLFAIARFDFRTMCNAYLRLYRQAAASG